MTDLGTPGDSLPEVVAPEVSPETEAARRFGLWCAGVLALLGLGMLVLKAPGLPTSETLRAYASFEGAPSETKHRVLHILMLPVGSLVVIFFRLTLGLEMLGPFRPILIAAALRDTGLLPGSLFFVAALVLVTLVSAHLKGGWLPYFARLSVLLALVGLAMVVALLVAVALEWEVLGRVAAFPIIVVALAADGFARKLATKGLGIATWCAATTLGIAIIVEGVFSIPHVATALLLHPELILTGIAAMVIISTRMRWELLARWNPTPRLGTVAATPLEVTGAQDQGSAPRSTSP